MVGKDPLNASGQNTFKPPTDLAGYDPTRDADGFVFDSEKAQRVVGFFEAFLKHQKGLEAGKPFTLLPWQRDFLATLFGWVDADGRRRYRRTWLEIPRKNGKSTLSSGLGLYLLFGDGEQSAEVVSAAGDRDQAAIVFDVAKGMIQGDAMLSKLAQVYRREIKYPRTNSVFKVISSDAGTKHGMNISGLIADEVHVWPNRDLWDTLHTSMGARAAPLSIAITTAGHSRTSIAWEQHDYALKVRDGTIKDERFLPVVYAAPEGSDWTEPETWHIANPSLGQSISLDYLEQECKRAKEVPGYVNTFLRLHLNVWTEQQTRWLPMDSWDASGSEIDHGKLDGQECWLGVDLATTQDTTCVAAVFPGADGTITVLPHFFLPKDNIEAKERNDRLPYRAWASEGHITLTPGVVTDYSFVEAKIMDLVERYKVQEVTLDRWNATDISTRLSEQGANITWIGQGYRSLSAPSKRLEELVLSGKLIHGDHPILRAQASQVMIETDPAGNIKPSKRASGSKANSERIDGIVALVMGLGRCMDSGESKTSVDDVYTDRGLRWL
jgi:phage terminase large subunit-like protein